MAMRKESKIAVHSAGDKSTKEVGDTSIKAALLWFLYERVRCMRCLSR